MKLIYVTGNFSKFNNAKKYLSNFGIELLQKKFDIDEIQSDSIHKIAEDKAKKAFAILKNRLLLATAAGKYQH